MAKNKPNVDELEAVPPVADGEDQDPGPEHTQSDVASDEARKDLARAAASYSRTIPSPVRTSNPNTQIQNPIDKPDDTLKQLLKLTGYKQDDVIGYNSQSRTIVTGNGGKYTLKKSGKSFRRILGPLAPSEKAVPEEDE